jgi:hypothetical protein
MKKIVAKVLVLVSLTSVLGLMGCPPAGEGEGEGEGESE